MLYTTNRNVDKRRLKTNESLFLIREEKQNWLISHHTQITKTENYLSYQTAAPLLSVGLKIKTGA